MIAERVTTETAPLPSDRLDAFLRELTELSCRHQLGIIGAPVLFLMESGPSGDFDRRYRVSAADELEFV